MRIPTLTKGEKRLLMSVGRHQTEDEPKNMSEICDEIGESIQSLQIGKYSIDRSLVNERTEHPNKILTLTDKGQRVYEALEELDKALNE